VAERTTIPIWMQSIDELYKEGDPSVNSGLLFLSLFGTNVNVPTTTEVKQEKRFAAKAEKLNMSDTEKEEAKKQSKIKTVQNSLGTKVNGQNVSDMSDSELDEALQEIKDSDKEAWEQYKSENNITEKGTGQKTKIGVKFRNKGFKPKKIQIKFK
jgi:hypothetical protein